MNENYLLTIEAPISEQTTPKILNFLYFNHKVSAAKGVYFFQLLNALTDFRQNKKSKKETN